jgi:hypothetical protein
MLVAGYAEARPDACATASTSMADGSCLDLEIRAALLRLAMPRNASFVFSAGFGSDRTLAMLFRGWQQSPSFTGPVMEL